MRYSRDLAHRLLIGLSVLASSACICFVGASEKQRAITPNCSHWKRPPGSDTRKLPLPYYCETSESPEPIPNGGTRDHRKWQMLQGPILGTQANGSSAFPELRFLTRDGEFRMMVPSAVNTSARP